MEDNALNTDATATRFHKKYSEFIVEFKLSFDFLMQYVALNF